MIKQTEWQQNPIKWHRMLILHQTFLLKKWKIEKIGQKNKQNVNLIKTNSWFTANHQTANEWQKHAIFTEATM